MYKGVKPVVTYYCPSTGNLFMEDTVKLLAQEIKEKEYPGTDHTPFTFGVQGLN